LGRNVFELIHPDDLPQAQISFGNTMREPGVAVPLELRIRGARGDDIDVEIIANNQLADPQIKGVIINARDIAARKRAEQALRESESRYRNLIEKSHSLICTHDMEGRLLSVNPAAATSLGYEPAEMVGRNLADFSHPGTQANLPKYMELMATV